MLVAGTSDSAIMLEWAMGELMRNPSIMKKAQEEIRETVNGNTISDADIQNMHYLKMIVKETLRLHGPPFLIPRISRRDCVVDGYDIPAKTRILVNALACATDPDSWEDPESFIPERFENRYINYSGTDFEFIPFGSGRRVCPGITFGVGIIENALTTLLYHFDWELPHGLTPHELDLTEGTVLSTLPKHPIEVVPVIVSLET
ncbi:costunolide synthase-like [Bidens hawaiensis]|uniref:costunolide synthase-like n=1 Tax=Bidens hawaiensis TaxID=980011 RepID=UPI004049A570